MACELMEAFAGGYVPQARCIVQASGGKEAADRIESQFVHKFRRRW